jgi:1-acyl-sn-glycerol-3-phosphate acyltransferase
MLVWIIAMPILFFLVKATGQPLHREFPHFFHRGVQFIFGLQVSFSGDNVGISPTLYVSNHISYIDIFVLGGIRAYYIAKSEVANWPILGSLARFQNTLFFERNTGKARDQLMVMQTHLLEGNSLILFPEGTSTNGTHVKPFKSSLFEAVNTNGGERIAIQAVTVAYISQGGRPMNQSALDHYAWYGTMPFGSHFLSLFSLKKVAVKVHFHPVCYLDEFESRKQCALHCEQQVSEKLAQFIS